MYCYALATCFKGEEINWCQSVNTPNPSGMFAKNTINQWKKEIFGLFISLEAGTCLNYVKDNHYIYILKSDHDSCFIACDTKLTIKQVSWLAHHLLNNKIALNEAINDMERFTQDQDMEALKQEITELKAELEKSIEKLIALRPDIEKLIEKTNNLPALSFRMSHHRENNCKVM